MMQKISYRRLIGILLGCLVQYRHAIAEQNAEQPGHSMTAMICSLLLDETWRPACWELLPAELGGTQADMIAGADGNLHIVSDRYYKVDRDGRMIARYGQGLDTRHGLLDYGPALDEDAQGAFHLLTRQGGDWNSGHKLVYSVVDPVSGLSAPLSFEKVTPRNYVLGLAPKPAGGIFYFHSAAEDRNKLYFYQVIPSLFIDIDEMGDWAGIWRGDTDAHMRVWGDRVHFVCGKCDPDGKVLYADAALDGNAYNTLKQRSFIMKGGRGRRGFPDLCLDGAGTAHVSYGSEREVHYARIRDGNLEIHESVLSDLGSWHLSTGLSAIAVDATGRRIVIVALRATGSKEAHDSQVVYRYTEDGGATWFPELAFEYSASHAGEGRRRPLLAALDDAFYLLIGCPSELKLFSRTSQIIADQFLLETQIQHTVFRPCISSLFLGL